MPPQTRLCVAIALGSITFATPGQALSNWAEASATVNGLTVSASSSAEAEVHVDTGAPAAEPRHRRLYRASRRSEAGQVNVPTRVLSESVNPSAGDTGEQQASEATPGAQPATTSAVEAAPLPQAVAQAMRDEATAAPAAAGAASTPLWATVTAVSSLAILLIDMMILLMIFFHRTRPGHNPPIEKRF